MKKTNKQTTSEDQFLRQNPGRQLHGGSGHFSLSKIEARLSGFIGYPKDKSNPWYCITKLQMQHRPT